MVFVEVLFGIGHSISVHNVSLRGLGRHIGSLTLAQSIISREAPFVIWSCPLFFVVWSHLLLRPLHLLTGYAVDGLCRIRIRKIIFAFLRQLEPSPKELPSLWEL